MKLAALLILASLSVAGASMQGTERPKSVVKTSHLGPNAVAVTCLNGADPTGTKAGNVLIISCGK